MEISEKVVKVKEKRSREINSLISTKRAADDAKAEDDLAKAYLNGRDGDEGILDFILAYLKETERIQGAGFNYPSLSNYKSDYESQYSFLANRFPRSDYRDSDDGNTGFYDWDDDDTKQAKDEINTNSYWLNFNDFDGTTSGGLVSRKNNILDEVGEEADYYEQASTLFDTEIGEDRYSSEDESEVQQELNREQEEGENGSGLLGVRTRNEDIHFVLGTGEEPTTYYLGNDELNNAYEDDTESLESSIQNYIDDLNNYISHLQNTISAIEKVENGNNHLFEDLDSMKDAIPFNDVDTMNSLINDIEDFIGNSSDDNPDNNETLYAYKNWFSNADGGGDSDWDAKIEFDDKLNDLKDFIQENSSVLGDLTSRSSDILDGEFIGDGPSDDDTLSSWRFFWIKTRIEQGTGTYLMYRSMQDSIDDIINKDIPNAEEQIETLEGDDRDVWILKPKVLVVFLDPRRDDDGNIEQRRLGVVVQGQDHATTYRFYRRKLEDMTHDNEPWPSSDELGTLSLPGDIDEDKGILRTIYRDTDIEKDDILFYRVRVEDEGVSGEYGDSKSRQSDVFDENDYYEFETENGYLFIDDEDSSLEKRKFALIKDSNGYDGFYFIKDVKEERISIEPKISEDGVEGKVYLVKCGVYVNE